MGIFTSFNLGYLDRYENRGHHAPHSYNLVFYGMFDCIMHKEDSENKIRIQIRCSPGLFLLRHCKAS